MVANPLIAQMVMKIAHLEITWLGWLAGSCVPALCSLAAVPYCLSRWHRPEIQDTSPARELAAVRLRELGSMSGKERGLLVILFAVMFGWVTSPWHGIANAFVALTGICVQLLTGLLDWEELLGETKAWDVLLWFAPLIMMADELNSGGVVKVFSEALFVHLQGLSWATALVVLALVYFYIHYVFASMTAHITALYPAFFAAALATGAPPMLAALPMAYFSSLYAGMTHYGTGSAPVFFGAGYVNEREWWRIGFLVSLVNVAIWAVAGGLWWKAIGMW
jgi:DASS family divalent anion:Na+ symporter